MYMYRQPTVAPYTTATEYIDAVTQEAIQFQGFSYKIFASTDNFYANV